MTTRKFKDVKLEDFLEWIPKSSNLSDLTRNLNLNINNRHKVSKFIKSLGFPTPTQCKLSKIPDNKFLEIYNECGSLYEILMKIGMDDNLCDYKRLKARLVAMGLEIKKRNRSCFLICSCCKKEFEQQLSVENAAIKKHYKLRFCDTKCREEYSRNKSQFPDLLWHLQRARIRHRNHLEKGRLLSFNITIEMLEAQWLKQKELCPYTGWKLILTLGNNLTNQASLDRIDSSVGYVEGNIQFVSLQAQYAKHNWSSEELINFGKAIAQSASS